MKIIELTISNIKRIKTLRIRPTTDVVRINGDNGSGKSSTLDSILMVLGGASFIPSEPVRKGQERGTIRADLGDNGVVEFIVERVFDAEKRTSKMFLRSPEGAEYAKAQQVLNGFPGSLSFDPFAFTSMKSKEQLAELRKLVAIDIDLDQLDEANRTSYQQRHDLNVRLSGLEERAKAYKAGIVHEQEVTPIDTGAMLDRIEKAAQHNATIERVKSVRASTANRILEKSMVIDEMRDRIERLQAQLATVEHEREALIQETQHYEPLPQPIDITAVRAELVRAEAENAVRSAERQRRDNYAVLDAEVKKVTAQSDALTDLMKQREAQKVAAIARAKFPVDGLSFGDGEVLFNGIPFAQASSAEQLRVSFALAAAANPRLKVVLIREGSLLDTNSEALLTQMAQERGYQVWMEKVGRDGAGILLEDGEVIAIDGAPVPHEEEVPATV